MYYFTLRTVTLLTVFMIIAFVPHVQAVESISMSELVNRAGMQRMLSQRIAKAYFYSGNNISVQENTLQMKMALERFTRNHALLKANVQDSKTKELLSVVESTFSEYRDLIKKNYSKENATRVLKLSDTLLEVSHSVVLNLEKVSGSSIDHIINTSGKQRMLSQQVAKFYIAYQAGFRDDKNIHNLKKSIEEFQSGLKKLMGEERNNREIKSLLDKIEKEWNRISPYFLKIREGGLPLMVLMATDEMTKLSDRVTKLYVEEIANK
ncbi:MAG: hypothetical protein D3920_12380 [Candidatus Electrothrix sp. AW2]|nr:hypothetical protein [Candidatus Electrothrix gigas]